MTRLVLVTGAFGYVGRTVVRSLAEQGWRVRALSRRPRSAPWPGVEPVQGDLTGAAPLSSWLEGCTALVHCAATPPDATTALFSSARSAGVVRMVHLSTTSVYRVDGAGVVREESAEVGPEDRYGWGKAASAHAALAAGGTAVRVLEPGCVYGGYGGWWSGTLLDLMRRGTVLLPAHGQGLANLIHVEDLAGAVRLALDADDHRAGGGRFIITDGQPIPWATYYAWLEAVVGRPAVEALSTEACRRRSIALTQPGPRRVLRAVWRRLAGRPPVFPLDEDAIVRAAARVTFSPARAADILGFTAVRQPGRDWRRALAQAEVLADRPAPLSE